MESAYICCDTHKKVTNLCSEYSEMRARLRNVWTEFHVILPALRRDTAA